MREKRIRRRLPCGLHELGALGHWLGDCSDEGLQLERLNSLWAVFRKGGPQPCRYRFYPGKPDEAQKELFREMGWDYAAMAQADFAVFRCTDPAAPELCTDPVVEAETYRRCDKKFLQSLIWMIINPIFSILIYFGLDWMLYGGMMDGTLWQGKMKLSLVHLFAGGFEIFAMLLLFFVTTWIGAVCRFRSIHALRRSLARGEPVDYGAPYPRRRWLSIREWEGLATVLLFASLAWMNCIDKQPFPAVREPVPAPLLAHLEGEGLRYSDTVRASRAEQKSTLLSELFCEAWQCDEDMSGWMDSTYIRPRVPQAAGQVFAVLAESVSGGTDTAIFGEAAESPVTDSRFDALVCYERQRVFKDGTSSEPLWTVTVRRGKQVIGVRYMGQQPLSRLLDELDDTLKRFEEG